MLVPWGMQKLHAGGASVTFMRSGLQASATACRATFTLKSLEVRVVALQGKNYVYAVKSLFLPINVDGCHVAASKTKKNVLITLQV